MGEKILELTEGDSSVVWAIIECGDPTGDNDNTLRIRKLHAKIMKRIREEGGVISTSQIKRTVNLLIRENILRVVERGVVPGDRAASVLYEFLGVQYEEREIVKVAKHVPGRRLKMAKRGESDTVPRKPRKGSIEVALKRIIALEKAAQKRAEETAEALRKAEDAHNQALADMNKYFDMYRRYLDAKEEILAAAE